MSEDTPETQSDLMERLRGITAENRRLRGGLRNAEQALEELNQLVQSLTATPWHPALLEEVVETPIGHRALVALGDSARLVGFHSECDADTLAIGRPVYLNGDRTLVMSAAGFQPRTGETAAFEHFTDDGRVVASLRGEELVLTIAETLDSAALRTGDRLLVDRRARMAYERFEGQVQHSQLLDDVSDARRDLVGGLSETFDALMGVFLPIFVAPGLANAYRLSGQRGVLLYGPAGNGKTLIARSAAAEVQRRVGKRCAFAVVNPGAFQSSYVGETEANIRRTFAQLAEEAGDDLAVLFLDEVESIGRIRGGHNGHHSDRFLAALLAEIDGFKNRGNVAIVAATNRRDLLDPALLSRLGDVELQVKRPDAAGARDVLAVHLPESVPVVGDSAEARHDMRHEILEATVSRLYAPNAANAVCEMQLRDGTRRTVHAHELLSRRLLTHVARAICQKAFRRHSESGADGPGGISLRDAATACDEAIERLATTLSIHNVRAYLDDLSDDADVVRVDAIRPRPARRIRYVQAA